VRYDRRTLFCVIHFKWDSFTLNTVLHSTLYFRTHTVFPSSSKWIKQDIVLPTPYNVLHNILFPLPPSNVLHKIYIFFFNNVIYFIQMLATINTPKVQGFVKNILKENIVLCNHCKGERRTLLCETHLKGLWRTVLLCNTFQARYDRRTLF
jgi:hypothetical protein